MALQDDDPPTPPPQPPVDPSNALLFAAIRADDAQQLERALSEGASVDGTMEEPLFWTGAITALMLAIKLGRNRIAKLLLERGADVHARRPHNSATALHVLCGVLCVANVDMLTALGTAGGDVNAVTDDGDTPILCGEFSRI